MPVVLLSLLMAAGALPDAALAGPGEKAEIHAELGELSLSDHLLRGEGGVVLQSGGLMLRAELLEYDTEAREASVSGQLLLVDGELVMVASEGTVSLDGEHSLSVRDALLMQKGSPQTLSSFPTSDPKAARRAGANGLLLKADYLERVARSRFIARHLELTSCDRPEDEPSDWSISASKADVLVGERAILIWPTFRIQEVPVMVLPAIYLPLSDRRTGLLLPVLDYKNGFEVDQPLFITLGRSYDLTLTAGWRFGTQQEPGENRKASTRGPRGSAEFRYAPSETTSGRLFVAGIDDELRELDTARQLRDPRGWRGELTWRHGTDLASGFGARADVKAVSDGFYVSDESSDVLGASVPYLRSQASTWLRGDDVLLAVSTGWYQDLQNANWSRFPVERRLVGANSPVSFQRPVSVFLEVPRLRLAGPLSAGLEVTAAHYAPMGTGAATEDRLERSFSSALPQTRRVDEPAASLPLTLDRVEARPSLALPLAGWGPMRLEAYAAARAGLSSYAAAWGDAFQRASAVSGRAIAGIFTETELSRVYGEGAGALRHSIAPRIELRASTPRLGESPDLTGWVQPLDEYDYDANAADPRLLQAIAAVSTRLSRRSGGEMLRLEVGQGLDLAAGTLGDSFGRLELRPRYFSATTTARFDSQGGRFSAANANLGLDDGHGDGLWLGYDFLADGGTDRMRAGLDDLFGPASTGGTDSHQQIGLNASLSPLHGLSLRYGVVVQPDAGKVLQHVGAIGLSSSCNCWRVDLSCTYLPENGRPHLGLVVDLKNLGSFGR
jgi:LPS-assembly protein